MTNSTVLVEIELQETARGFINQQDFQIIINVYSFVFFPILSFSGVITNTINIKTFAELGLQDGVSVSLIALSISDLCWCVAAFIVGMSFVFTELEVKYDVIFPVNPFAVTVLSGNVGLTFYAVTAMTTTFLAVARCMCVIQPLRFKFVFTKSRSIVIHLVFVIFAVTCYASLLSQMGTREKYDASVNITRHILWFSKVREDVKEVVYIFYGTIFSITSQILILGCVIVMAASLQRSIKFRQGSATVSGDLDKTTGSKLSGKELQVVKQVVLISTIYMLCSLPKMSSSIYNLVDPEFNLAERLSNIYTVMQLTSHIFDVINSTSTFFIYYNYNSKFRSKFL